MSRGKLIFIVCMLMASAAIPAWSASLSGAQRPPAEQLLPEEEALPFDLSKVKVASIQVFKAQHRLDLLDDKSRIVRSYKVSLGYAPVGPKVREGDGRTPEGIYYIDMHNEKSSYYRSLHISYPSKADIERAHRAGVTNVGGGIFIHGKPNDKSPLWWRRAQNYDWTNGCIAVSDEEIREIWNIVHDGTPIVIKP